MYKRQALVPSGRRDGFCAAGRPLESDSLRAKPEVGVVEDLPRIARQMRVHGLKARPLRRGRSKTDGMRPIIT